jgi:Golgi phosphoprotein 3
MLRRRGKARESDGDEGVDEKEERDDPSGKEKNFAAGGGELHMAEELFLLGLKGGEGSLSFWNESSFALRGCLLMDLEFREKIGVNKESRRRTPPNQILEVTESSECGEPLLDEVLRHVGAAQKSISSWLDVLNGEDWSFFKSEYTLSQVRERLAKGLVDKGILRNEQQGFLSTQRSITEKGTAVKKAIGVALVTALLNKGNDPARESAVEFKRMVALSAACYQAEFIDNLFDEHDVSQQQRSVAIARLDQLRKVYAVRGEKQAGVEHPVLNGVLAVFADKD